MQQSNPSHIIIQVKKLVESDRRSEIRLNANGGNSILVVCDPIRETEYITYLEELLPADNYIIIDLNQCLIDFIRKHKTDLAELYDLLQSATHEIFKAPFGEESQDLFKEIMIQIQQTFQGDKVPVLINTGSLIVRKTVSGFIKLLHPDGVFSKEDIREYLIIAIEMRRRVKEQLKRIGGMEFWDTNFSYIDKDTQEENFVGLPEERGSHLIENNPLPPGVCYTATSDGENNSLVKIEVVSLKGSGRVVVTGTNSQEVRENIKNTYNYLRANEKSILNEQHSLTGYDLNIQVSNLMGAYISGGIGSAVYVAIISSIYKKNLKPGLAVLGNISIGGAIERALNFADKVSLLSENGAKTVLVPMDNLGEMTTLPQSILGKTDTPFYGNSQMILQKAILGD